MTRGASDDGILRGPALHSEGGAAHTLVEALRAAASVEERGFLVYDHAMQPRDISYRRLVELALCRAHALRAEGVRPGERVGLMIEDYAEFVLSFFGLILAGAVPVPMASPVARNARHEEASLRILQSAEARVLIVGESCAAVGARVAATAGAPNVLRSSELAVRAERHAPSWDVVEARAADDLCFLQFSSGSTSAPKGVMVSHGNLVANATAMLRERLAVDPAHDVALSWLPLFHDMGLIGFVCATLLSQVRTVLYPTPCYIWKPSSWMQLVDRHRATITFAPSFAYRLSSLRQRDVSQLDLSCLRVAGCGAEPVQAEVMRLFARTYAPARFRAEALMPSYGMAEHTLGITFSGPSEPLRTVRVDRSAYERGFVRSVADEDPAPSVEIVSCGKPFAGHEVAVVDAEGTPLSAGRVGAIVARGPSATRGYFGNSADGNQAVIDGWLQTGDLGFVHEGELFVSGRSKDTIIINGRNLHPQDIEWAVERVSGVRAGGVAAVGVNGPAGERVVLLAETVTNTSDTRDAICAAVTTELGFAPHQVLLLPPNSLPKTSSGKVQRARARALFAHQLEPLGGAP
jgi:fatty-acyl-CoA synthase